MSIWLGAAILAAALIAIWLDRLSLPKGARKHDR